MAAHAKLQKSQIEQQLLSRFDRAELLLRDPVSYTHLDVYKRQLHKKPGLL